MRTVGCPVMCSSLLVPVRYPILLLQMNMPLCSTKEKFATNDDFCLVSMYLGSCRVIVYTIFKLAADSAPHSQLTNIT